MTPSFPNRRSSDPNNFAMLVDIWLNQHRPQPDISNIHHFSTSVQVLTDLVGCNKLAACTCLGIYLSPACTNASHHQVLVGSKVLKRSEEHTSELQSLMRISYAVF